MYLSDYGMYYPCWAGYATWDTAGCYTANQVQTGNYYPMSAYVKKEGRSVCVGSYWTASMWVRGTTIAGREAPVTSMGWEADSAPANNLFSFAAIGLGYLLTTNTLADGKTLTCPSTAGDWQAVYGSSALTIPGNLWKRIGGSDAYHLEHPADVSFASNGGNAYGISSTYQYRLMPVTVHWYSWHYSYGRVWPGVKPQLTVWNGAPAFRTQKMLAGRSVVIDNIDNVHVNQGGDVLKVYGVKGGAVQFHHRDGYNVLYGDQHTRWYGDPGQRIAYISGGGYNGYLPSGTWYGSTDPWNLTAPAASAHSDGYGDNQTPLFNTAQRVWMLFDQAEGIDIP
jgi:hypothetical protein